MILITTRIVAEFNKIFNGDKRVGDSLRLEGRRMTTLDVANASTLGYKSESSLSVNKSVLSDKSITIASYDINGNPVVDGQGNPVYIKEHQLNVRNSQYLRNVEPLNLEVDVARRLKVGSAANSPIIDVSSLVINPTLYRVKDSGWLNGKPENDLYVRRAVDADDADLLNNTAQSQLVVEKARIAGKLISDIDLVETAESGLRVKSAEFVRKGTENLNVYDLRDYFFATTQAKAVYVNLSASSNALTTTDGTKSFSEIMTYLKTDTNSEMYKANRLITADGVKTGDEYKTWIIGHNDLKTKIATYNAATADRAVKFGSSTDNVDITEMDARIKATTVDLAANASKLQNNTAEEIISTTRSRVLTDASNGTTGLTQGEVDGFFANNKVKIAVKAIKVSEAFNSDKFEAYTLAEVKAQVKSEGGVTSAKYIYSNPNVGGQKSYIDITNDITTAKSDLLGGAATEYNTLKKVEDIVKANKTAIETSLTSEASTRTTNDNTLTTNMGTLSSLTTTVKSTIVGAINELDAEHGTISTLMTTAKNTFVAAINEIYTFVNTGTLGTEVNSIESSIGLASDGTLATISGKNYVNGQSTVLNAVYALDSQLKTTTDKFSAGGGSIKVVVSTTNTDATFYPTLVSTISNGTELYADNGITPFFYNPGLGTMTVPGSLTVTGDLTINGTTTTINSTTLSVDDKNIELGSVASPSDTTADGGGITLKGSTDKTFLWVNSNDSWASSEHINIASGKEYRINGTTILSETSLSSSVVTSSLTSVGTITSGTWSGSFGAVSGANLTSLTAGNLTGTITSTVLGNSTLYVGSTAILLNRGSANQALTGISSIALPGSTSGTITISPVAAAGTTSITIPATTGTLVTTGDTGTVTNTMLAGSIANEKLTNNYVTIGSTSIGLGATGTSLAGLSSVTSTVFTGALNGNATSATKLLNSRTIGMTGDVSWTSASFDGSGNVTGTSTLATITNSGEGTFLKITRNGKGLVTGTLAVAQADITGLLGDGSITNAMLVNSTMSINGVSCGLGTTNNINTTNSMVIKVDTGTTEGNDLYTFNGSSAKTLDIKQGANITFTKASGSLTIALNSDVMTEINAIETAVGLDTDGTFVSFSGTNYIRNVDTFAEALIELDTIVKTLSTNAPNNEVNAIETAVGLNNDGTLATISGKNYVNGQSTVLDAVYALDTQLKSTNDNVAAEITNRTTADSTLQTNINTVDAKTVKYSTLEAEITDSGDTTPTLTYVFVGVILTNTNSIVFTGGKKLRKTGNVAYTLTNDGTNTTLTIVNAALFVIGEFIEIETITIS